MKILISGSSGFVGSRVLHQWQGRAELFTFPRGSLAAADETAIRRFVETVQPDVILHLAALSDTGYCQQHPEESQRANVELPIWMAKAARDTGAKLISFSSDQVYAGVPCSLFHPDGQFNVGTPGFLRGLLAVAGIGQCRHRQEDIRLHGVHTT
ncbi:MAG: sugar nucleotide-binding protein, partial [Faecalibacterium sp.]|nr:sugar nucleotide-binding protein [Faecalibacterium sp.]